MINKPITNTEILIKHWMTIFSNQIPVFNLEIEWQSIKIAAGGFKL